jgi:hypothetical protein
MGYTHYWKDINKDITTFDSQTLNAIKAIALDYNLCYEDDRPYVNPEILENKLRFNGRNEAGCETFYFNFTGGFCKTGERDYDTPVCLVLMAIKHFLRNNIRITSDGNDKDWTKAFEAIGLYIPDALFQIKERELIVTTKNNA